jgi:hypothetical protein
VKLLWFEFDTGEFFIGDLDSYRIVSAVEFSANHLSLSRGGVGDPLDDHFMTDKWTTAPVLGDVAEHAVLDLVPLTRPERSLRRAARRALARSAARLGGVRGVRTHAIPGAHSTML